MKKYLITVSIISIVVVVCLLFRKVTSGVLSGVQGEINSKVDFVYKTGEEKRVIFLRPEDDAILVLIPPYANMVDLEEDALTLELKQKIQSVINSQETGHLFYIKQGYIEDHCLLSGLAEPILGMSTEKEIVFLLTRKKTSGRPVTIEIIK